MKLYHATTVYHFLNAVALVQKNDSFGEDDILLAPWLEEKFSNSKLIKAFFKNHYFYDAVVHCADEEKLEAKINESISAFCKKNKINLANFDEIIVGGVQYNFGIYLCNNGIKFSAIEESCGILSKPEVVENIDFKLDVTRAAIAKNLGIYSAQNDAIIKIYCDVDSQEKNFTCDRMCDFKVLEVLKTMDCEKISTLLELFGVSGNIEVDENSAFLLTQQFSSLKIMDLDSHILIYQLFCDFFLKNKSIVIKPHPDDLCYYSQFISNAKIIREKFPSELTPFVFKNLPQTVATISSTGIHPLKPLFGNVLQLDFRFEREFKKTLKYYVCLKLLSKAGIKNCKLFCANDTLFSLLARVNDIEISFEVITDLAELKYSPDTAVIIDECSHEEKNLAWLLDLNFSSCVFLNTDNTFGFYRYEHKELYDILLPVVINKNATRSDEFYLSKDDEVIYAYSKDKEIYKKMKNMHLEENLENTGVSFKIANLTDDQLEIERLKGILTATEKRLVYYINKEKEAEKK